MKKSFPLEPFVEWKYSTDVKSSSWNQQCQ